MADDKTDHTPPDDAKEPKEPNDKVTDPPSDDDVDHQPPTDEPKFTQADVDRIVKQRAERIAAQKFADYDELKVKAAEHDKAVDAQKTAEQRAQDEAQAAKKRADELTTRAVRGEIKALAAGRFADPDDPGGFLDVHRYVNDKGEIDTDTIKVDLDDLLTRKPHLAKTDDKARAPAPVRAQGSSGNGAPAAPTTPGMGTLREAYKTSNPRRRT
jgi:hypothetical protein